MSTDKGWITAWVGALDTEYIQDITAMQATVMAAINATDKKEETMTNFMVQLP
jgi:hypothetical protein